MKEHFVVLVTTTTTLHPSTRQLATRLAARSHAVLVFLHVVPLRRADGDAMVYAAMDVSSGKHQAWLHAQTPSDAGVRFRHRFETGEPEEVVARFVREHEVDLVVVEEPPRNWMSEALWRGFAEQLIRHVDCPVVIGGPGFLRSEEPTVAPVLTKLGPSTVAELLNVMVDARSDALRCWMDQSAEAVRRIANSENVRAMVASAGRAGAGGTRAEQRLNVELEEHRRALRAQGWQLTSARGTWSGAPVSPATARALTEFMERVAAHGRSTSLPLAVEGSADRLVVLSGATVAEGEGLLLFVFDAESEFLRILGQPGPLPTFETYAFDELGLMLSSSSFPDHLLRAGLLPNEGAQTPLRLRVAEPASGPVEAWPLTHLAQRATLHDDGVNTAGYVDYRGTLVVGAWRWNDEYRFGIAAEVDRDAAFR